MALRIEDPHGTLERVHADSPTKSKPASVAERAQIAVTEPPFEPAAPALSPQTSPQARLAGIIGSIDQALAGSPKAVNTRVAKDLWELLTHRAEEIDVPLRLVITDALVRALEIPASDHARQVQATKRREQIAKIDIDN